MSYAPILRNLPEDLRLTMLELVETVEENVRSQLAVRREDFDALHTTVHEVADVVYRTEERVDRLETAIVRLAEAQERSEERLDRLETAIRELTEAQKETERKLGELTEAQKRLTEALEVLTKRVDRNEIRLNKLVGFNLESAYREKASGYFGHLLRKARAISFYDIEDDLETRLSEDELNDLQLADVIIYGRPKQRPDVEGVWLVVEVSAVVDRRDVERAQRRAAILRKVGYPTVATVAGEERTEGAEEAARVGRVLFLQNGSLQNWDEALAAAL